MKNKIHFAKIDCTKSSLLFDEDHDECKSINNMTVLAEAKKEYSQKLVELQRQIRQAYEYKLEDTSENNKKHTKEEIWDFHHKLNLKFPVSEECYNLYYH